MTAAIRTPEQADAIERLKGFLSAGDTVYCITKHVSRSGMQRRLDLYTFKADESGTLRTYWLTWLAAKALGWRVKDDTLVVDRCGMDIHFHAVYELAAVLFGDGYKLNKSSL